MGLLEDGTRGARRVGEVTGINRAVESATEEAIVRAVESEAVEKAVVRVVNGPAFEEAVQTALTSEAIERTLREALDSEMIDRIWEQLLASDEVQKLVERIAEAPEVRAAITSQGAGLIGDVADQARGIARNLDTWVERFLRRILHRRPRIEPTGNAGAVTRMLAVGIDAAIVNLSFLAFSTMLWAVANWIVPNSTGSSAPAILVGTTAWMIASGTYLFAFWALAGQTPGMRFMSIQIRAGGTNRIGPRHAFRRVVGFGLSVATFGIGFLGVIFSRQRRAWPDRLGGTDVIYVKREIRAAPWTEAARTEDQAAAATDQAGPAQTP